MVSLEGGNCLCGINCNYCILSFDRLCNATSSYVKNCVDSLTITTDSDFILGDQMNGSARYLGSIGSKKHA